MTKKWIRPGFRMSLFVAIGLILFSAYLASAQEVLEDVPVTMSPYKIILNAELKGALQDVQAVIGMSMRPSEEYRLGEFKVTLYLDGVPVTDAFGFRYCYIDDNFLASFDREVIQTYLFEKKIFGTVLTATVAGWYETLKEGEDPVITEFSGDDSMEIVKPGNKK